MKRGYPRWFLEFRNELDTDHKELLACRTQRAGTNWSFDKAVERTRAYYRDRISSFARVGSITAEQRDELLALVDLLGDEANFPVGRRP